MKRRRRSIKKKPYIFSTIDKCLLLLIAFLSSLTITKTNATSIFAIDSLKTRLNEHINISSIRNILLGKLDIFNTEKTEEVMHDLTIYDKVSEVTNGITVSSESRETVMNIREGVVVKKTKNTIIVKGLDGLEYHYSNLNAVNVNLYDYVKVNDILGISFYDEEQDKFTYTIQIKQKGNFISVKDVIGIA